MDKLAAVSALRAALTEQLAAVERVAASARDEASGAESKQEGKYDTRATEASYLARGQAVRVVALRGLVAWFQALDPSRSLDRVGLSSLVELDQVGWVFVAPTGGLRVDVDGVPVRLVSPDAPLGAALIGLEEGDGAEVASPRGLVETEVVTVL
jgi:hypothetical protein